MNRTDLCGGMMFFCGEAQCILCGRYTGTAADRYDIDGMKVGVVYARRNTVWRACIRFVDGPEASEARQVSHVTMTDDDQHCKRGELLGFCIRCNLSKAFS